MYFDLYMYKIVLIIVIALNFVSCNNWKVEPATSKVLFINASPGTQQVQILSNGNPLFAEAVSYGASTGTYMEVQAGKRQFSAIVPGNSSNNAFINQPVFLTESRNYSAFLTKYFNQNLLKDTLIVYPDTLRAPSSGRAKVRFVNLFPEKDSTLMLLASTSGVPLDTLFSNRVFVNISGFIEVGVSPQYTFTLRKNGKNVSNVSLSTEITAQNFYTIIAMDSSGMAGNAEKKLKLQIIQHN